MTENFSSLNKEILTLYKYFVHAVLMRDLFRKEMDRDKEKWLQLMVSDSPSEDEKYKALVGFFMTPPGIYFMYSYSAMYIVIEGWQELKLQSESIDKLLESPYVDRLKRFRNATFHHQNDLLSNKHLEFFGSEEEETEVWIGELYAAFSRYFEENTVPIPKELKASFTDMSHADISKAIRDYFKEQN